MKGWVILLAAAAMASSARGADAGIPQRTLPGLQPDGDTLLHNQWPIHPVGDQVGLGDFPVGMAVHPGGRLAAVLHAGQGRHEVRIVDLASGQDAGGGPPQRGLLRHRIFRGRQEPCVQRRERRGPARVFGGGRQARRPRGRGRGQGPA